MQAGCALRAEGIGDTPSRNWLCEPPSFPLRPEGRSPQEGFLMATSSGRVPPSLQKESIFRAPRPRHDTWGVPCLRKRLNVVPGKTSCVAGTSKVDFSKSTEPLLCKQSVLALRTRVSRDVYPRQSRCADAHRALACRPTCFPPRHACRGFSHDPGEDEDAS